jgi:hypothetical protein
MATMDFPQAFEFIRKNAPDKEGHHPKCSYRQAGMLCDCSVLWAEYYRREVVRLKLENEKLSMRTRELNAELDKGDSWAWIRDKFKKCRTQFKWYTPREDSLVGTRYEVMGWLHVLFAHADPKVYMDIAIEHQKKTDDAEAESHRRGVEIIHWTEIAGAHLCRAEKAEAQFGEHVRAVGRFLTEMYQAMVDPLEEPDLKVAEICALLLKRATEDRQATQEKNERVVELETALAEIWKFAIYGCGTKGKDARGRQFGAIEELARKAVPDVAERPESQQAR